MNRVHKDEMIRFANSPIETKIWSKARPGAPWRKVTPIWYDDSIYILDDKFVSLRKQFVDDPTQLQRYDKISEKWETTTVTDLNTFTNNLCTGYNYRIKPKTVTKWRWVMADVPSEQLRITEWSYTEEEAHKLCDRVVCKIEETAKESEE